MYRNEDLADNRVSPGAFRRVLMVAAIVLAALAIAPAVGHAATLDLVFDNTSPGAGTGSAPWDADNNPGNDSSASNNVVRTNDIVTYHWGVSANDGNAENATLTQTLPVGMTWAGLPAYCLAGGTPASGLSDGGRTITCNLGTLSTGTAFDYFPIARVGGTYLNGDELTTNVSFTSSSADTDPVVSDDVTTIVSAEPRVDLTKDFTAPSDVICSQTLPGDTEPTWGQCIRYPMSLIVESIAGKGSRGNERLAQPLSWTDQLSGSPDIYLRSCSASNYSANQPLSNYYSTNPAMSIQNSGTITCTQPGGPGTDINMTVNGADLTGQHIPTLRQSGAALPANLAFLGQYTLTVFVPNDAIPINGGLSLDDTLTDFNPSGFSPDGGVTPGTPNFGGAGEPTDNNSANAAINREDPAPGVISSDKCIGPTGNTACPGGWGNNQTVSPGQTYWEIIEGNIGGNLPMPNGAAICEVIDTTTQVLTLDGTVGGPAGQPAWLSGNSVPGTVLEYGTGGPIGHTVPEWNLMQSERCDDDDSADGWFTNPALVPGGLSAITKVRLTKTGPITPSATLRVALNMKALGNDPRDNSLLPTGTIVADFLTPANSWDDGIGTWAVNQFNPTTGGGEEGARVVLTRSEVRIQKNTVPADKETASVGEVVTFSLNPTVSGQGVPGTMVNDVTVTDTLPAHMTYQPGTASIAPASVTVNMDGTTTIVWDLGDREEGALIPPITFDARVKLNVPNGQNIVNSVVIASPDDPSTVEQRTDSHTLTISLVAGIIVTKSTSTPWIEPGDDLAYEIDYANNSVTDVDSMDVIDVLPYDGDARNSEFNGTARLSGVTVSDGESVYFTSAAPSSISSNPQAASNAMPGGTTTWCLAADFGDPGCPAGISAATGVRVINEDTVLVGEVNQIGLSLETEGNLSADVYFNNAGMAAEGVTLPVTSPVVKSEVVSSALGDYVWFDTNRNGIQDAGEPPVADVAVRLTGTDKHGDPVSRTTTTDANGRYRFGNLISGQYEITFTAPDGREFTIRRAGSDNAINDSAFPNGTTGPITIDSPIPLREDQEDLTWDAGLIWTPGSITIVKDTRPNRNVDFQFTSTGGLDPAGFVLNDDGQGNENSRTFEVATPGQFTVTEGAAKGWKLTGLNCVGNATTQVNLGGRTVSIDVAGGQNVTCTFVNEQVTKPKPDPKPNLTIAKKADRNRALPGSRVAYTLLLRNTRKGSVAKNVKVCDRIPAHMTVVNRGSATFSKGRLCWSFKRLAYSKQPKRLRYVTRIDANTRPGTKLRNVVSVGGKKAQHVVHVKRPASGNSPAGGSGGVTG